MSVFISIEIIIEDMSIFIIQECDIIDRVTDSFSYTFYQIDISKRAFVF